MNASSYCSKNLRIIPAKKLLINYQQKTIETVQMSAHKNARARAKFSIQSYGSANSGIPAHQDIFSKSQLGGNLKQEVTM